MTIKSESQAAGAEVPTYANWKSDVPCDWVPVGGGERVRGVQIEANVNWLIEMRYIDGVKPTMQLVQDVENRTANIVRVLPVEGRRRRLMITATEADVT